MPKTKTKKQHFVPRFYLEKFADTNNKFYVYDFKDGKILANPVFYETQCFGKYFYGEDGIWERKLSNMEGKWAAVLKRAISEQRLNENDFRNLKEFVLYQRQRTDAANVKNIEQRFAMIKECVNTLYAYKGWKYDDIAEKACMERANGDASPTENLMMAEKVADLIEDLNVLIVRYETTNSLITSDAPVIALNPFLEFNGFGYGNIGVAYIMPISSKHLLIIYDGNLFSRYEKEYFVISNSEDEVANINRYELINAERMAFSKELSNFELVNEIIENRNCEKIRDKTQYLGPVGHRLMITQASGIKYYYEISYLNLPSECRRIPYQCREPIPREYEEDWKEKLGKKYRILSMAYSTMESEERMSRTDLKIGCRRMETLAANYWRKHGHRFHTK